MKRLVVVAILILLIAGNLNAQKANFSIVFAQNKADETTSNYQRDMKRYLEELLKKQALGVVSDTTILMTGEETVRIGNNSGNFWNNQLSADIRSKGAENFIVVYYSINPFEKQTTSGGVKKITYGCRTNTYVQVVSASRSQILNSQNYIGSAGTSIMGTDTYRTQAEAINAALNNGLQDFSVLLKVIQ